MDTSVVAATVLVGAIVAWAVWFLGRAVALHRKLDGPRVVTCPEDGRSALVAIDVAIAVTSDAGSEPARLSTCSRWTERGACDQPCCRDAHADSSRPVSLVRAWAAGRQCASCGGDLVEPRFGGHHLALLEPTGITREWADVPTDRLPLALATSLPLCWNCHMAATFRREHPDLVVDRDLHGSAHDSR
ncbi:MAG: hypothetical protein AB7H96_09915 [Vicinamibacterales bacterium]